MADERIPLTTMGEVQEKVAEPAASLKAEIVPYSSVVGSAVSLQNEAGVMVALIMISVPNPSFDYKATALPIAERIVAAFNKGDRQ